METLSPQHVPILCHPPGCTPQSSPSALRAEICLFFPLQKKKKKAQGSPQQKHHLTTALGKLAASPGFPIPGFFPFLELLPIETTAVMLGQEQAEPPEHHKPPSLAQPSSPSPPYCSNSTRHGYKNKTAM